MVGLPPRYRSTCHCLKHDTCTDTTLTRLHTASTLLFRGSPVQDYVCTTSTVDYYPCFNYVGINSFRFCFGSPWHDARVASLAPLRSTPLRSLPFDLTTLLLLLHYYHSLSKACIFVLPSYSVVPTANVTACDESTRGTVNVSAPYFLLVRFHSRHTHSLMLSVTLSYHLLNTVCVHQYKIVVPLENRSRVLPFPPRHQNTFFLQKLFNCFFLLLYSGFPMCPSICYIITSPVLPTSYIHPNLLSRVTLHKNLSSHLLSMLFLWLNCTARITTFLFFSFCRFSWHITGLLHTVRKSQPAIGR